MQKNLVTVTMSAFNNAKTIENAIKSVLKQTHTQWELIIIDDASSDGTFDILQKYSLQDSRVKVYRNEINRGTYWNRNRAILFGQGEFISNLDGDDTYHPEKLKVQIESIKNCAACLCHYDRGNKNIKVGSNTILFKRKIIKEIGYFDSVRYDADTEYLQRISICFPIIQIPDILYYYTVRPGSLTEAEETGIDSEIGVSKRRQYQQNYKNWQRSSSFPYLHFPQVQRSFSIGHPDQSCPKETITVSIATFPERMASLKKALDSIYPWVDRINIFLNDYETVPEFLQDSKIHTQLSEVDQGDNGKFYWSESIQGYHFTCDDDITYSRQYFEVLLAAIEKYNRTVIVGMHGSILNKEKEIDFYSENDRKVWSYRETIPQDRQVDFLGTGAMAYHSEGVQVPFHIFQSINMTDAYLGTYAKKMDIPLIRCTSDTALLEDNNETLEHSIYLDSLDNKPTKFNRREMVNN